MKRPMLLLTASLSLIFLLRPDLQARPNLLGIRTQTRPNLQFTGKSLFTRVVGIMRQHQIKRQKNALPRTPEERLSKFLYFHPMATNQWKERLKTTAPQDRDLVISRAFGWGLGVTKVASHAVMGASAVTVGIAPLALAITVDPILTLPSVLLVGFASSLGMSVWDLNTEKIQPALNEKIQRTAWFRSFTKTRQWDALDEVMKTYLTHLPKEALSSRDRQQILTDIQRIKPSAKELAEAKLFLGGRSESKTSRAGRWSLEPSRIKELQGLDYGSHF